MWKVTTTWRCRCLSPKSRSCRAVCLGRHRGEYNDRNIMREFHSENIHAPQRHEKTTSEGHKRRETPRRVQKQTGFWAVRLRGGTVQPHPLPPARANGPTRHAPTDCPTPRFDLVCKHVAARLKLSRLVDRIQAEPPKNVAAVPDAAQRVSDLTRGLRTRAGGEHRGRGASNRSIDWNRI